MDGENIQINTHIWHDTRYEEFVQKSSTRRLRKKDYQGIKKKYVKKKFDINEGIGSFFEMCW